MQNYFPATYQQYYPQQNYAQQNYQLQQTYPQQSGITWVDGVSSAKAYPVANGTSILLMDSNENAFYIKSADQSGMPSIRIFDYSERVVTQSHQPQAAQVVEQPVEQVVVQPVAPKPAPVKKVVDDANREKYTATMEKSLRKRVKIAAATAGIQVSTFIEEACLEKLEREGL